MERRGPSVLGAFTFYLSGMIVATSFITSNQRVRAIRFSAVLASLVLLFGLFGALFIPDTPWQAWVNFAGRTYRALNAPGYYVIGTVYSLLAISLIYVLVGSRPPARPLAYVLPVGTASLVSFTAGNVILNLSGRYVESLNLFVFLFLFLTLIALIARHLHRIPYYAQLAAVMNLELRSPFLRTPG